MATSIATGGDPQQNGASSEVCKLPRLGATEAQVESWIIANQLPEYLDEVRPSLHFPTSPKPSSESTVRATIPSCALHGRTFWRCRASVSQIRWVAQLARGRQVHAKTGHLAAVALAEYLFGPTSHTNPNERDDDHSGQTRLDPTPETHVESNMECADGARRILEPHGTVFLNDGYTYTNESLTAILVRIEWQAKLPKGNAR